MPIDIITILVGISFIITLVGVTSFVIFLINKEKRARSSYVNTNNSRELKVMNRKLKALSRVNYGKEMKMEINEEELNTSLDMASLKE